MSNVFALFAPLRKDTLLESITGNGATVNTVGMFPLRIGMISTQDLHDKSQQILACVVDGIAPPPNSCIAVLPLPPDHVIVPGARAFKELTTLKISSPGWVLSQYDYEWEL